MLKAIDAMLDGKPSEDTIKCARKVLSEVIIHLESSQKDTKIIINNNLDEEAQQAQEELLS